MTDSAQTADLERRPTSLDNLSTRNRAASPEEEVPENWGVRRLKYLVSINDQVLSEATAPDHKMRYVDIGGVDHIRGIHSVEDTVFGEAPDRARRVVRHGDTIVSTVRTYLRAIASIRQPAPNTIVSTGFAVLRPKSSLCSEFAYYALNAPSFIDDVVVRSVGANYPAIKAEDIGDIPIAVPLLLDDQRTVAAYLDRETAKIDALIARNEVLIERLKEQRAALISRTVTRGLPPDESRKAGIDPHPKLKPSGVEWPSRVPEHWTVKRLKYVARRPIENGINEAGIHDDPEWPRYIRITDIKTPRSLRHDTFRSLPPEKAAQAFVDPYDILLARVGEPGISYLHAPHDGTRACFAGYLVRYSPDAEHVVPGFVAYWTESHVYWACVRSRVIQTTIQNFSATRYKNLPMPLPPLAEQKTIVLYLDQETAKIDKATTLAQQEADLLREYRPRLISDVVTGKVDVRCLGGAAVEAAV